MEYCTTTLTCTFTVFCGSWTCSSVASMSSATTRPVVNLSGLSDSPVGSMMVAVALWICPAAGQESMRTKKSTRSVKLRMAAGDHKNMLSTVRSYLFRQPELQQAALSQSCLEDLHHLHWFAGRQPWHQLQQRVHKAVLQVGQLCQKQPGSGRRYGIVRGELGHLWTHSEERGNSTQSPLHVSLNHADSSGSKFHFCLHNTENDSMAPIQHLPYDKQFPIKGKVENLINLFNLF